MIDESRLMTVGDSNRCCISKGNYTRRCHHLNQVRERPGRRTGLQFRWDLHPKQSSIQKGLIQEWNLIEI